MESKTLSDLRTQARLYANERQAGYLTDASNSIDILINDKAREVRSWVLSRPGGRAFWSLRETFPLVANQAAYRVDGTNSTNGTDYQAESIGEITLQWGTRQQERVDPMPDADWERINGYGTWGQTTTKCYSHRATYTGTTWGQSIVFAPTPTSVVTCSVEYIPNYQTLSNSTDTIVGPEGMGQAIALMTAAQIKGMQGEDAGYLQNQIAAVMSMMDQSIRRRTANYGPRMVDVHPDRRVWDERWNLPPA